MSFEAAESAGSPEKLPRDWTKGSIVRNLLGLSWPMVVTEGFAVLVMTIDLVWVGRLGSVAMAGVGVGSIVAMLVMAAKVGLIVGLRAIVARHVGSGDSAAANHVAQQALVIGVVFGLVTTAVGTAYARPIVDLFGVEPDVALEGAAYLRVMFAGMMGFSLRVVADNTMQASGDTVTPMKITILSRSVHLLLAPAIIFGWWLFPALGVAGAAVANVVAHTLAMFVGMGVLFAGRTRLRLSLAGFRLDLSVMWRMVRIGLPALVMMVQRVVGYMVLTWLTVPFGSVALAAHSLLQRVDTVFFLPSWAVSAGAGVLVGQNLGAEQPERAEKSAWFALAIVQMVMMLGALAVLLWAEGVVSIFNTEPDLVSMGSTFLRIAAASYAVMALVIVVQQALAGAGDTLAAMLISIMVVLLQVLLAYVLSRFTGLGVLGIRWSIVVGIGAGAAASAVYFRLGGWKQRAI